MPAISSARRRGSFRARRRRFCAGSPVDLSIFGARLRTRCPQYGHSVTYGLTSDPQFLQTTKRSAPRAISFDDTWLLDRGGHDLGHDLAQVVVGLPDHDLAGRPVPAREEVLHAVEGVGAVEVLGVLAQAVEQPA